MSEPEVCYEDVENDLNNTRIRIIGARAAWAAWAQRQAGEAAAYADSVEAGDHEWRSLHVIDDALRRAETELETALRLLDEIAGPDKPSVVTAGDDPGEFLADRHVDLDAGEFGGAMSDADYYDRIEEGRRAQPDGTDG